jgi:phosphoenolpyruvate carboxylase
VDDLALLNQIFEETLAEQEGLPFVARFRDALHAKRAVDFNLTAASTEQYDEVERIVRALTLRFRLTSLVEERRRAAQLSASAHPAAAPGPGSFDAALADLAAAGLAPTEIRAAAAQVSYLPVLTAHPTEARRRTLIAALSRMRTLLDRRSLGGTFAAEVDLRLREEMTNLWRMGGIRTRRVTALDEVRSALVHFDGTIFRLVPRLLRSLDDALGRLEKATAPSGLRAPLSLPTLRWGTWIGGDRDGNPNVNAETTREAMRIQADHALRALEAVASRLMMSIAATVDGGELDGALRASLVRDAKDLGEIERTLSHRFPDEPYRRRLGAIAQRIARTRRARIEESIEVGSYATPQELINELRELRASLAADGLERSAYGELLEFEWQVEAFGFHFAMMEIRQARGAHHAAITHLTAELGKPGATTSLDLAAFKSALAHEAVPGVTVGEVLATIRVAAEIQRTHGEESLGRYVISGFEGVDDLHELLALFAWAEDQRIGADLTSNAAPGSPKVDIVPLLESARVLERAAELVDEIVANPVLQARIVERGRRFEVMLGYSDTNKESGYLSSVWLLHLAEAALVDRANAHNLKLTLFHGRGGAIGRGGGPTHRAILGQHPAGLSGGFKVTEQGEVIASRYSDPAIAFSEAEQIISALLTMRSPLAEQRRAEWEGEFAPAVGAVAQRARKTYQQLIPNDPAFEPFFRAATPIAELGSRPSVRGGVAKGGSGLTSLRAIPWVFSWSQARVNLPGWYGLGALRAALDDATAMTTLSDAYRRWPFFQSIVDNAAMILAKSSPEVAEEFAALGGAGSDADATRVWATIVGERTAAGDALRRIAGTAELLASDPELQASIEGRAPEVNALSRVQVQLLRALRSATDERERDELSHLVRLTVSGVAAGLRNTG